MFDYGLIKLSREQAINATLAGRRVYLWDLDEFEKIRELLYMSISEIIAVENLHNVIYVEVFKINEEAEDE